MNGKLYIIIKKRLIRGSIGRLAESVPTGIAMDLANSVANSFPSFMNRGALDRVLEGANR